jgi:hypothetical protein
MKRALCLLATLTTTSAYSSDFLKPMYNPGKGEFVGHSRLFINSMSYDSFNDNLNSTTANKTSSQSILQNIEVGLGKGIVALVDLDYVIGETKESGSNEEEASGLRALTAGARYRLNNAVKLPMTLDVGAMFKPSFSNRTEANTNDEGTVNSGGHDLVFFGRTGEGNWYAKASFTMHLEQTADDATSGNESYTVDAHTSLMVEPGMQFSPMSKLLLDVAGHLGRVGERKFNYAGGGDQTVEARWDYGVKVKGYYHILSNLSVNAGLDYLLSTDQNVVANTDLIFQDRSAMNIHFGASYKY